MKGAPKKPTAKEQVHSKLLEYLGNPENEFLSRMEYATKVLGYAQGSGMYKHLNAQDLDFIEQEALEMRHKRSAKVVTQVMHMLAQKAIKDKDVSAAKEYLNRVMGKAVEYVKSHNTNKLEGFDVVLVKADHKSIDGNNVVDQVADIYDDNSPKRIANG